MGPNDTPLTMCAGCGKFVQHPLLHAVEIHGQPDTGGQLLSGSEYDHAVAVIYEWITRLSTTQTGGESH